MFTVACPPAAGPCWTVPLTGAVKPEEAAGEPPPAPELAAPDDDAVPDVEEWWPNRLAGVPARLAQSLASGPPGSQTSRPNGSRAQAPSAVARAPTCRGHPAVARDTTAATTMTTQATTMASIQPVLVSLPVPSPWRR